MSPRTSSNVLDDQLAPLLQKCPVIWDRKNQYFGNLAMKQAAFERLAAFLNTTPDIIRGRYRALRERYIKEKKKIASGFGTPDKEVWHLMPTLSFLESVETVRRAITHNTHQTKHGDITRYIRHKVDGNVTIPQDLRSQYLQTKRRMGSRMRYTYRRG